jgi:hypothetical protein
VELLVKQSGPQNGGALQYKPGLVAKLNALARLVSCRHAFVAATKVFLYATAFPYRLCFTMKRNFH